MRPRADAQRSGPGKLRSRPCAARAHLRRDPCVPLPSPPVRPSPARSAALGRDGTVLLPLPSRSSPGSARRALYPSFATPCEAACRASCAKARGEGGGWPAAKDARELLPNTQVLCPWVPGTHPACDEKPDRLYGIRTGRRLRALFPARTGSVHPEVLGSWFVGIRVGSPESRNVAPEARGCVFPSGWRLLRV